MSGDESTKGLRSPYSLKKIILTIAAICQIIALANGVLTITVDILSKNLLTQIFHSNLPQLTFLFSLSWRNWKIMESLAETLVLGGNNTYYNAQVNYHLAAINYESSQSSAQFADMKAKVGNLSDLVSTCFTDGNVTPAYDANLLALDTLATAAVDQAGNQIVNDLKSMQEGARGTLYTNSAALGIISILRLVQIYFSQGVETNVKSNLAKWTGSTTMLCLSVLESAAFIIITMTRLRYIDTLVYQQYPLYESSWQIKYLDPILTGSAMRFTLSNGNSSWTDRYNNAIDPLVAAYEVTSTVLSPEVLALNDINFVANNVLVDLETQALEDVSVGATVLTGLNYTSNKAIYLFAVDSMLILQERTLYAGLSSTESICEALVYFAAILTSMSLLMFVSELAKFFNDFFGSDGKIMNRESPVIGKKEMNDGP